MLLMGGIYELYINGVLPGDSGEAREGITLSIFSWSQDTESLTVASRTATGRDSCHHGLTVTLSLVAVEDFCSVITPDYLSRNPNTCPPVPGYCGLSVFKIIDMSF